MSDVPKSHIPGGPHVVAALLCERVLQEKDGVNSLIRVVDRFVIEARGPGAPEYMPESNLNFAFYVAVKAGEARHSVQVRLTVTGPDGIEKTEPIFDRTLLLEGPTRGQNVVANIATRIKDQGPYWINVYLGDRMTTRTPFDVVYLRNR